jgi:GAF domain-containing protein/sugar diacid utilization regulator
VSAPSETEAALLALLVRDAPEPELEASVARMVAAAANSDDAERVALLGRHALELHRMRADDRRRALGLTLISDTAADLATHRDTDELLHAICRRARLLLGTEVAYVTLRDEAHGDTYVHTTDGIVSDAFRTMRLPAGTGLGGLVAHTGEPAATADYTADERLAHSDDIDRRVAVEGLHGIVAAPLKRGVEVIGVLMSGSREVRHFDPAEVGLFTSLASHAAIALRNARLIEEAERAVSELAEAHAELQRHTGRLERVGRIHERLAALAVEGCEIGELLDEVLASVGAEIELVDAEGELLARRRTDAGGSEWVEAPVAAGLQPLGRLRLRLGEPSDGVEHEVLERAAVLVSSLLLAERAQSEAQHRHRSMLLEELLSARGGGPELRRRASRAGIALDTQQVVLVIAPDPTAERWAWLHAVRAAQARRAVVGTVSGRIVAIEPGDGADEPAGAWMDLLTIGGAAPTIGVAAGAVGAEGVRAAHREAGRVVGVLGALQRSGSWASVAELGIFGQMLGRAERGELHAFLARVLGPVRSYDERRSAELEATVRAYLREGGHLGNSARRLGIHVNTLYQRLERLDEVLGPGWRHGDRRLELEVAVRLDALERELGATGRW